MKSDTITRTYAGLTAKEHASLVWHYCSQGDELELARVMDAIPRVTMQGPPLEYVQWSHSYMRLAAWWGIQHWQARSRHAAALGGIVVAEGEQQDHFWACLRESEALLLALDVALDEAGKRYGIDTEAIRRISATTRFEPLNDSLQDPDIVMSVSLAIERILPPA